MNRKVVSICAMAVAASLQGCATVELERQGSLSDYERQAMGCQDIEKEMSRVLNFVEQVSKSGGHRWYDVPAVLESRWIGNIKEKSEALESANLRMVQLWTLRDSKQCTAETALQPLSLPIQKAVVEEGKIN